MKILVITSCTGEKAVSVKNQLTLIDFKLGPKHVAAREKELQDHLLPAERLYTGLQHQRLMRGVDAVANKFEVDLRVLSAGYGLVEGDRELAPYETTFATMKPAEIKAWSDALGVPRAIREALGTPFDLCLVLLGDDYLAACQLDASVTLGGPTILFCGKAANKKLPDLARLRKVILSNADAKRFSCGLVGIKGELASRILDLIGSTDDGLRRLTTEGVDVLDLLAPTSPQTTSKRGAPLVNPTVDRVIEIGDAWLQKPHRKQLAYFIPEWDDLVDPDYDFDSDTHSGGSGDWGNEVYAHQMYPEPNYDGILISKVVAEKSKKKAERINRMGVHRFLRVPRSFPIMGDCGAFGYINDEVPPYSTSEILDYYSRLDFDFGVSIDHFVLGDDKQKRFRYDITVNNAESFIREHLAQGLPWTPIGAVQGWDADSYVRAAKQYVAMGYKYLGLGAMVPRRTPEVLAITEAVRKAIPDDVRIHLFGVVRLPAISDFIKAGANSADSAAWLRNAWMGTDKNYLTLDAQQFGAIRIPQADKSFRAKRMVSEGRATSEQVQKLDKACIDAMHAYDQGKISIETAIEVLHEYDQLITPDRPDNSAQLRRTLEAMPWKHCPCDICREDGIDVIIFRGNNRNRRRGFHNTYTFYKLFQRAVAGEQIVLSRLGDSDADNQLGLFERSESSES